MITMRPQRREFSLKDTLDVVQARQCAREMARDLGFGLGDQARIATAVSEVARRALSGTGRGSARLAVVTGAAGTGLECVCTGGRAKGTLSPMEEGTLGGIEYLVDELLFGPGEGEAVVVVLRKWVW
jgi:serine/threonine-protein kinase RsbT